MTSSTWRPTIDPATGHLSLPDGPGLGIDLDVEVARAHPYDPEAYLNIFAPGWEKRLGARAAWGDGMSEPTSGWCGGSYYHSIGARPSLAVRGTARQKLEDPRRTDAGPQRRHKTPASMPVGR